MTISPSPPIAGQPPATSDGPHGDRDKEEVSAVREILKRRLANRATITLRDANVGLAGRQVTLPVPGRLRSPSPSDEEPHA